MPGLFDPKIDILPAAQREIWPQLAPAPDLSFVLYGGTAVALHLGHRVSIDFDFFKAEPLEKARIEASFQFATKLKAILDRAEAKDYRDISAMLSAGVSLERALGVFAINYRRDPALPLKALGFFKDGDLPSLPKADQDLLRTARDRVSEVPEVRLLNGLLPIR
jgi:hypothetical protein